MQLILICSIFGILTRASSSELDAAQGLLMLGKTCPSLSELVALKSRSDFSFDKVLKDCIFIASQLNARFIKSHPNQEVLEMLLMKTNEKRMSIIWPTIQSGVFQSRESLVTTFEILHKTNADRVLTFMDRNIRGIKIHSWLKAKADYYSSDILILKDTMMQMIKNTYFDDLEETIDMLMRRNVKNLNELNALLIDLLNESEQDFRVQLKTIPFCGSWLSHENYNMKSLNNLVNLIVFRKLNLKDRSCNIELIELRRLQTHLKNIGRQRRTTININSKESGDTPTSAIVAHVEVDDRPVSRIGTKRKSPFVDLEEYADAEPIMNKNQKFKSLKDIYAKLEREEAAQNKEI